MNQLPDALALALAPFAPPQSTVREQAARINADMRINQLKASGELRQREDHRALLIQVQEGGEA